MNEELSIKVQAFLDGELSEADAREVSSLIASDADVAALHKELKHTRAALAGFEKRITVPETREFYWSKIQREIERAERTPATAPEFSLLRWLRRALVPATGLALLVAAVLVLNRPATNPVAIAPAQEAAMTDSGSMTFRNYQSGATLVWLSFPAENGLAHDDAAGRVN